MKHNAPQFELPMMEAVFNLAGETQRATEEKPIAKTDNTREMFSNHCVRFNADELEKIKKDSQRKQYLIAFFNKRGWLNCSHKSLERLESEFEVIKQH